MLFSARCSSRHFSGKGSYCGRRPRSNKRLPPMSAQPLGQNVKQAPSASNNQPHLSLSQISNVFLLPICLKPFNLQLQSRKRKLFLLCSSYFYLRSLSVPLLVLLLRSWSLSKLETFLACLNSKDHFMQKIT